MYLALVKTGSHLTALGLVSLSGRDACKDAGIKNFRFHDLRHDFCSKLVQNGANLYSVAGLAGHKDIKTTQRYAHLSPEKLRSTIQILNSGDNLATIDENENHQECRKLLS